MLKSTAAAFAALMAVSSAGAAFAADQTQFLALDRTRLYAQSAAGKSIGQQIEAMGKQIDTELGPEAKGLETELKAIQDQTKGLTNEQLKGRTDIKARIEAFEKRKNTFDVKRAKRARELVATQNKADEDFEKVAQPILTELVRERGALLVVELRDVVYADQKIDITQDAITRLDQKVKTVPVTKVTLPDQPAQAPKPSGQ